MPINEGHYFSLWLAMPTPPGKKPTGCELEVEATGEPDTYYVELVTRIAGYTEAATAIHLPPGAGSRSSATKA